MNYSGLPPIMPNISKRIISEQFELKNYPGRLKDLKDSSDSSLRSLEGIREENEEAETTKISGAPQISLKIQNSFGLPVSLKKSEQEDGHLQKSKDKPSEFRIKLKSSNAIIPNNFYEQDLLLEDSAQNQKS